MTEEKPSGAFPIVSPEACPGCHLKPCKTVLRLGVSAMPFAAVDVPFNCPFRVEDPSVLSRLEGEILKHLSYVPLRSSRSFNATAPGGAVGGHAGQGRLANWLRQNGLVALWLPFGNANTMRLKAWQAGQQKAYLRRAAEEAKANEKEMVPMFEEEDDDISLDTGIELDEPIKLSVEADVDDPIVLEIVGEDG